MFKYLMKYAIIEIYTPVFNFRNFSFYVVVLAHYLINYFN